jgi:Abnormal spindle-like microcephaly-assoc'd, ASPM-SPD-2-Hydin
MRLPQSFTRYLSVFSFTVHYPIIGVMLVLFGLVPASAFAATPQLVSSPSSVRFGHRDVGQTETLMVTVTNAGPTSVTVSEIRLSNPAFSVSGMSLPQVLSAGQSVDVSISFTPTTTGWMGGTINFSSNASNSTLLVEASGNGVNNEPMTASPSSLSFGSVPVGSSASLPLVLTNAESWKVNISAIQATGNGFSISGTFPLSLRGGQSIALTVTYTPQSAGVAGGSVFVAGPGVSIPLTGTGTNSTVGTLAISPAPLNYGNVTVGTTDTLPLTMSAAGGSVTVSSATSSSSQFVLQGASLPFTIAPGQSVSFNVAFTPGSSGTVSGALSFASNASNSQATESLTGVGTQPVYTVNLSWNASSNVVGYNVYRGTSATGSFSKITSNVDANTAFTDNSVVGGSTYYYAATAVNSSGQESTLSTPVQVAVP